MKSSWENQKKGSKQNERFKNQILDLFPCRKNHTLPKPILVLSYAWEGGGEGGGRRGEGHKVPGLCLQLVLTPLHADTFILFLNMPKDQPFLFVQKISRPVIDFTLSWHFLPPPPES